MSSNPGADEVAGFWSDVIKTVNGILEADRNFGFRKIEVHLNPSLEEILHSLAIVDAVLNSFLDSNLLEPDEIRQALNSKQCVVHIRRLASALKNKDAAEYDEVIKLLHSQAKI